jgi:tRNA(Ile)-lysidine synthase
LKRLKDDYSLELIVAHLNHSIRKEEAKRDADFVSTLASSYNLPFELGVVDVPKIATRVGLSLQEAARKARYNFFDKVRKKSGANKVALGHHMDDQVETVIMRLLRGAGAKGLKGMDFVREGIYIRPLLDITRKEIEDYAKEQRLSFVTDATNFKDIYLRNRVRTELLPFLEENYNPNINEDIVRLSRLMKRDDEFLEKLAEKDLKDLIKVDNEDVVTVGLKPLLSIHEAIRTRVLRNLWRRLSGHTSGIYNYHIESILNLLESDAPNSNIDLPSGIRFVREYGNVSFTKKAEDPAPPFKHTLNIPGVTVIPEAGLTLKSEVVERSNKNGIDLKSNKNKAFFDYGRLHLPIYVRGFEPGDSFIPFGMEGKKKVKDLFIELKIPRTKRTNIPLLFSQDNIVWVVGLRRSEEAKVIDSTNRVLTLEIAKTK